MLHHNRNIYLSNHLYPCNHLFVIVVPLVVLTCSLYTLAEMFDLPPSVVHSTISKMIINEELQVCDLVSFFTVKQF
jgi:hypothetical protein